MKKSVKQLFFKSHKKTMFWAHLNETYIANERNIVLVPNVYFNNKVDKPYHDASVYFLLVPFQVPTSILQCAVAFHPLFDDLHRVD